MRGQTQLVFVFILAAVIIGMIILFGFKGVQTITDASEETAKVKFLAELRNDIKNYETLRGSSKVITYQVPSYIDEICFCSRNNDGSPCTIPSDSHGAINSYSDGDENLFLFDANQIVIAEDMGRVISPELKCFDNTGRVKIRLTGKGNGVTIQ